MMKQSTEQLVGLMVLSLVVPLTAAQDTPRLRVGPPSHSAGARYQESAPAEAVRKKSFFKTRRGIVIVSLSTLAVGFTLWSKRHDRIQSPAR